jgi:hypothetical protein
MINFPRGKLITKMDTKMISNITELFSRLFVDKMQNVIKQLFIAASSL